MKQQRFLNWTLILTAVISIVAAWLFGPKLVAYLPHNVIPTGASPREAIATSKLGESTAELIARLDQIGRVARDGRFWSSVLHDVGEQLLRFSIAQLHKFADSRQSRSVGALTTLTPAPRVAGSLPQATPTTRSASGPGCFDYEAAQEIVVLTNNERAQTGLPALAIDETLMALARQRSSALVQNYSHDGLRGTCGQCGENIGWRTAASFTPLGQVMGWMNSTKGHRENMLNVTATHVGVGVCRAPDGRVYSVLDIMH